MRMHQRLTKDDERALMRALKDRRERATPQHHSPSWVAHYWRRIAS
jgi:hypothetical protein